MAPSSENLKIEYIDILTLRPAEYNPRQADEIECSNLKKSIERFGIKDPAIVNRAAGRENVIIGGHFRIRMAKEMGYTQFPCVYVDIPDIENEKELNLRLNKNTGSWNLDALAGWDESMLKDVGFTSAEMDRIFQIHPKDEDDAPDLPTEAKTKRNSIYALGRHRLMCGDSCDPKDVNLLMGTSQADLIFTDPPYNVNYKGEGKETSNTIENDNMSREAFREFLTKAFNNYKMISKDATALYCCYASRTHREFEDAIEAAGFEVKNQIIWVKLVATMGWGDYRWKHEPIFYAKAKGQKCDFYGDRKQYTTWEQEKTDDELLKTFKSMIKLDEFGQSTVWRFNREGMYKHPTQKPIELITRAIVNSSAREELIVDLFLGSGSTLIASEASNRRCYGMEIDPKHCDVIIQRWEELTGQKAIEIQQNQ